MFRRKLVFQFCLLLPLLMLWTTTLPGQQLSIGQIRFQLGMTTKEALDVTHDPIYLENLGNTSATWIVREKRAEDNYVVIGSIFFKDGRIVRLERDLKGFSGKEAKDVGAVLFQAVERLKREDVNANVSTRSTFFSSASGQVNTILIGTGLRRIKIVLPDNENAEMTISEVLTLGKLPVDRLETSSQ